MNDTPKRSKPILQWRLNGGRLELQCDELEITRKRGIHLLFSAGEATGYSTESTTQIVSERENGSGSDSKLEWLPATVVFDVSESPTGIHVKLELDLREAICVQEIVVRCPFNSTYDRYSANRETHMMMPWHSGTLWSGIPDDRYIVIASSTQSFPPVRITLDENARVFELRIGKRAEEGFLYPVVDIVRYGSERCEGTLVPGRYPIASFFINTHDEHPPVMRYPKELFSHHPIRIVNVVSRLDSACTKRLSDSIRDRLPVVWISGRVQPVAIRVMDLPPTLRDLVNLAGRLRAESSESLTVLMQLDLYAGFGWRFNLLALLTRTRFKMKIDPAGNCMFFSNNLQELVKRRFVSLQQEPKKVFMRLAKGLLILGWVILVPVFFIQNRVLERRNKR